MKVYEEAIKLRLPKSEGRSVGLHVSEVIRDLAFKGKVLDPKYMTELALDEQDTTLMQMGLAWEDYLDNSSQFPGLEYHPGELKVRTDVCAYCGEEAIDHMTNDNGACGNYKTLVIYMSPDGLIWDNNVLAFLAEVKLTKKSSRDFAQGLRMGSKKTMMYVWQVAAYLKALQHLAAKLFVLFVNGNYSYDFNDPEGGSVKKCFRLEFTQEEIDSNWRMLVAHAQEMIRAGRYQES